MIAALVLAGAFLSAPLLSATEVGDGDASSGGSRTYVFGVASGPRSFPGRATTVAPASFRATTVVVATPQPAPPPTPAPTPPPPPPPPPPHPPPPPTPTPVTGLCPDALSINVVNLELTAEVQAGAGLLAQHFGCQKFRLDGSGVPIKFAEITPLFNAKVLGYAQNAPGAYEIWLNPDCWGVVQRWAEVIAHELGHYLGWQHSDGHPYMWLSPPPGSYAAPGDGKLVCY